MLDVVERAQAINFTTGVTRVWSRVICLEFRFTNANKTTPTPPTLPSKSVQRLHVLDTIDAIRELLYNTSEDEFAKR